MSLKVVIVLLLGSIPPLSLCQPGSLDCVALGFEADIMPSNGDSLEVCSANQQQCCTDEYITLVKGIAKNVLTEGLNQELNETYSMFGSIVERLNNYFNITFLDEWKHLFPNPGGLITSVSLPEISEKEIRKFLNNLVINEMSQNFSTSEFVLQSIVVPVADAIGNLFSSGNSTTMNCIAQQLRSMVNSISASSMTNQLEKLREGVTLLINTEQFLRNCSQFELPTTCASRLVSISFCGHCNGTFLPLCSGTCGALVRACYSPYDDVLPEQLNTLWNVSAQALQVLNTTLQDLFNESRRLFNGVSTEQLRQDCGISFPESTPPQSSDPQLISNSLMQGLKDLKGRGLSYSSGERGPLICQQNSAEGQLCTNSCGISSFCTANSGCRCYDVSNPVISLSKEELTATSDSIGELIRDFLEQQMSIQVLGIVIPEDVDDSTNCPTSSGSQLIGTMAILLISLISCVIEF